MIRLLGHFPIHKLTSSMKISKLILLFIYEILSITSCLNPNIVIIYSQKYPKIINIMSILNLYFSFKKTVAITQITSLKINLWDNVSLVKLKVSKKLLTTFFNYLLSGLMMFWLLASVKFGIFVINDIYDILFNI